MSVTDAGPWIAKTEVAHPFWTGHLICSGCGAQVLHMPGTGEE